MNMLSTSKHTHESLRPLSSPVQYINSASQSASFTMALPTSDAVFPISKQCSQQAHDIYNGVEVDVHVHVTAEREEFCKEVEVYSDFHPDLPHEFEFLPVEKPKLLVEKESMQKEKQILVDPISLKGSLFKKASFNMMMLPPPLPPAKSKFLSFSLPNSANSSPRFSSVLKKKLRNETKENPRKVSSLARQHSAADYHLRLQREMNLRRSKSCMEGRTRAPSDDLDFWRTKPDVSEYDNRYYASISKTIESTKDIDKNVRCMDAGDKEFKCGALCLFLPGFSKVKPVRARKVETDNENVISRTVSLEKFECGSWASSAVTHDPDDDSKNLYFDLPLELIRASVNDAHSPVTAAFIFDKEQKGILKNSSTRSAAKKSDESPRHVRFSTSSHKSQPASPASCITPRLRKAREEFNAFLEAQGA